MVDSSAALVVLVELVLRCCLNTPCAQVVPSLHKNLLRKH